MLQRSLFDTTCPNENEECSSPKRKKREITIPGSRFGQYEAASYVILEEN